MTYSNIFWLDDNPIFLEKILQEAARQGITQENLMARTTFAFDRKMADDILTSQVFDLYILDADFPHRLPDYHKNALDAILHDPAPFTEQEYIRRMNDAGIEDLYSEEPSDHTAIRSNFVRVYDDHLKDHKPVVVFSGSGAPARARAFHLTLPFYSKNRWCVSDLHSQVMKQTPYDETASLEDLRASLLSPLTHESVMA